MTEIAETREVRREDGPRPFVLWGPILVPLLSVLVALEAAYALVGPACRSDATLGLHGIFLVLLIVALASIAGALRWRRRSGERQTEHGGADTRVGFMAIMGVMSGASALVLVLALWMPLLFFSPCGRS